MHNPKKPGFARTWTTSTTCSFALLATGALACSTPPPEVPPGAPGEENPGTGALIAGFAANDPRLNAVGALVVYAPDLYTPIPVCGAALIAPETVLTAKHCLDVLPYAYSEGYRVGFSIGPDARSGRVVEVAAFGAAPISEGGFTGTGSDVAVLHLDKPVTEIKPLALGTVSEADLGKSFAAIGYGIQDNAEVSGTRRLGKQGLKARQGKVFEHLFGSFEAFYAWFLTGVAPSGLASDPPNPGTGGAGGGPGGGPGMPIPPDLETMARQLYDETVLLPDYEVVTGGFPGDSQLCYGDSGSPLLKKQGEALVGYGVVTGGIGTNDLVCDLGAVYSVFGPETMAFLEEAQAWTDTCGDVPISGLCDGNVAKRCTNVAEGRRRVVDFDCGLVGLTCNTDGPQVSCDSNVFGPPGPRPGAPPPAVRALVDRVFRTPASLARR